MSNSNVKNDQMGGGEDKSKGKTTTERQGSGHERSGTGQREQSTGQPGGQHGGQHDDKTTQQGGNAGRRPSGKE